MPDEYQCDQCDLCIATGSYHGWQGEWYNALYCRHCGAAYTLVQSTGQFLEAFSPSATSRTEHRYLLRGPRTECLVVVPVEGTPPAITCGECGVTGPFGSRGPITDEAPAGCAEGDGFGSSEACGGMGICPRCRQEAMHWSGRWIT